MTEVVAPSSPQPSPARSSPTTRAAFMPLLDAAPLIVAARQGFAEREGLEIALERETSWASLRDRIAVGRLDAAHMLAPIPIAANLGLQALPVSLVVPMALGYGGNTVTVSDTLRQELSTAGLPSQPDAIAAGRALAAVVRRRREAGEPRLLVGVVHTHSAHYYQLAYWLAAIGVDPQNDVDIVVVPPSQTAVALETAQVDAFCAGEPWGSLAEKQARGHILLTNESIWRSSPEKVLGVRRDWYEADPARTHALVRSLFRAAEWCDQPENAEDVASVLSASEALALPREVIAAGLARRRANGTGFLAFARNGAAFPWLSHASWFYTQMVRWQKTSFSADGLATARSSYRPDIFRAALAPLGIDLPAANSKVEGTLVAPTPAGSTAGKLMLGPDTFFDRRVFDPSDVAGYLAENRGSV